MKKIKCLLFAMLLLTSTIAFNVIQTAKADSINLLWDQFYGGSNDDFGTFFDKTNDGGLIITGVTYSYGVGGGDLYLVKTDSEGEIQWTKTLGGNGLDLGCEVQQTSDGGYIVAGRTESFGSGYFDTYLVKVDPYGNLQWSKTYGGSYYDGCKSVVQTADGGYALVGITESYGDGQQTFLLKTDSNGNQLWMQLYGGPNNDGAECFQQTLDGGYIIVGSTNSAGAGSYDIFLIKTDDQGNQQWIKTFGESGKDGGRSVKQTSDGGYIAAGDISGDYALIRTDAGGNAIWLRKYGGAGIDEAEHVSITCDGGFIVTGITSSFGAGGFDSWSLKTDEGGTPQWDATFGGSGYDLGTCIEETPQGCLVLGSTASYGSGGFDVFLISINTSEDKTPPLVFIQFPEDYEIYAADSELKYNFWATDDTSPSPSIVASVTDFTGEVSPVSSGDPLPTSSGVYVLTVTATDLAGNIGVKKVTFVVYDPTAGFVSGGGWIYSPKGSYMLYPSLEGKANFGFVSKYKKGASAPTGNTEFVFQVANLNFHSTSYQWLVVAGAKAQYKGEGTINGGGIYGFMLTAIDGQLKGPGNQDMFRIKIWNKATDTVIYDNQLGESDTGDPTTVIAGGSIVIHK